MRSNTTLPSNAFRGSLVQKEGLTSSHIFVGTVEKVHTDSHTVDVSSMFDRKFYDHVPIMVPYVSQDGGAGFNLPLRRGTPVVIVVPGDSSSPFVLGCLPAMRPPEGNTETPENPEQEEMAKRVRKPEPSFDCNRFPLSEGEQAWMGPVDNGFLLYEQGITEIRSGALNHLWFYPNGQQRSLYRSKEVLWTGGYEAQRRVVLSGKTHQEEVQVSRRKLDDEHGSLRIKKGGKGTGEPDSTKVRWTEAAAAAEADENDMVMEVSVIPNGFSTGDGELAKPTLRNKSTFRALLTLAGNLLIRTARSVVLRILHNLRIEVQEKVVIRGKNISLQAENELTLAGESVLVQGNLIQAGGGSRGVVAVGDTVMIQIPPGTNMTGTLNGQPYSVVVNAPGNLAIGTILSGSPTVKVP